MIGYSYPRASFLTKNKKTLNKGKQYWKHSVNNKKEKVLLMMHQDLLFVTLFYLVTYIMSSYTQIEKSTTYCMLKENQNSDSSEIPEILNLILSSKNVIVLLTVKDFSLWHLHGIKLLQIDKHSKIKETSKRDYSRSLKEERTNMNRSI